MIMTFNPDIDRISLDDRVKALENQTPPGGGGGGGGTSNLDAILLNPKVIDNCKENAITEINTGWVLRVDIQSWGALTPLPGTTDNFPNVNIKLASFFPVINGKLSSASTHYVRIGATTNFIAQGNNHYYSGSKLVTIDDADFKARYKDLLPKSPTALKEVSLGIFNAGWWQAKDLATGNIVRIGRDFSMIYHPFGSGNNTSPHVSIGCQTDQQAPTYTIAPGFSFGFGQIAPFATFVDIDLARAFFPLFIPIGSSVEPAVLANYQGFRMALYSHTSSTPQDLPAHLQPFYPTSWYT